MRIIDLSHTIEEGMPVYPGTEKPVIRKISSIDDDGFLENYFSISTHTGTHLDVPAHLFTGGKTLECIEAPSFFGKAARIDCRNMQQISKTLIKDTLKHSALPDFLLFFTGWDSLWGEEKYFQGYPILDKNAAEFIASCPLKGIGIDAASFDAFNDTELRNHKILIKKNLLLIENLCNLVGLPEKEFFFSCFPLKIRGVDGSPVRAIGITEL
jgi:arylformamidase